MKQPVPGSKGKQPTSQMRADVGIDHPDWNKETSICQLNEYPTGVARPLVPDNGQLLTVLGMQWILHSHARLVARIMRRRASSEGSSCFSLRGSPSTSFTNPRKVDGVLSDLCITTRASAPGKQGQNRTQPRSGESAAGATQSAVAPAGNAVKHFVSHEISRHALARGSPRNRAPSARRLMCASTHKTPKTTGFIDLKSFTALAITLATIICY